MMGMASKSAFASFEDRSSSDMMYEEGKVEEQVTV
jgi:hypothetical protein